MPKLPLEGIRILDFCWLAAGPVTTRLLADLGAEVTKIESLQRLDRIREVGPQPASGASINTNGLFHTCNANKRSATINLNTGEGLDIVRELVAESDIVSSNFTPNRMDRWGLGYDDLRKIRDDIIVLSMPVMGKVGPHAEWGSYGNGIVAMCGLGHLTGSPDREPVGLGTLHSDFTVPYLAALQSMAALYERDQKGRGQFIEVAQYEAATHLLDTELHEYLADGAEPPRLGNRSPHMAPHGVFPAAGDDRWVAIAVADAFEWQRLAMLIGRDDWASDPALHDVDGRRAIESEIESAIAAWTASQDPDECAELLTGAGVPAAPVWDIGDIAEKSAGAAGHFVRVPQGEIEISIESEPALWDGERLPVHGAPSMGEHNDWLLHERLGRSEDDIAELFVKDVLS